MGVWLELLCLFVWRAVWCGARPGESPGPELSGPGGLGSRLGSALAWQWGPAQVPSPSRVSVVKNLSTLEKNGCRGQTC